jgi:NADH dehydrogenase [ubiquinone] 1 alpha subcomplex assembly factor 2
MTGDTKAGVLIGTDKFGNKFYENKDELPRPLPPF